MDARAAVLWEQSGSWEVVDVQLEPARAEEVLVQMAASGLCHSDDHLATGDFPETSLPFCGGHGTFATWQIYDQRSVIKVRKDLPLDVACLVACGAPTGWGSATNAASVRPGDTALVTGTGGVGINAVQGARFAGAAGVVAVDPSSSSSRRNSN